MEIRIDSQLLDEQIALCEKYEFHGDDRYEQDLFGGIANLLVDISDALTTEETVEFFAMREEDTMEPKYTIEQYKRCLEAAALLSQSIEMLQEAQDNLNTYEGWTKFGMCLDGVFMAQKFYEKTNTDCCIEAVSAMREE